jgi:hypothetical protein
MARCSGEWPMGRIYEQRGGPEHMRWFWSLFGIFGKPVDLRTDGHAATLVRGGVASLACLGESHEGSRAERSGEATRRRFPPKSPSASPVLPALASAPAGRARPETHVICAVISDADRIGGRLIIPLPFTLFF